MNATENEHAEAMTWESLPRDMAVVLVLVDAYRAHLSISEGSRRLRPVVAAWNNFLGGCRVAAVLWQVERDAVMTAVIDTVMTVGRAYTAEEKTAWQRAVIRGVFTRLGREEESHQQ